MCVHVSTYLLQLEEILNLNQNQNQNLGKIVEGKMVAPNNNLHLMQFHAAG
jgi:hypothetical protein